MLSSVHISATCSLLMCHLVPLGTSLVTSDNPISIAL